MLLIYIGIGVAVVVAVLAIVVARKPKEFRISRSVKIDAPAENAFALVNDFRAWRQWSPFEKLDPNMQRTYGGPADGVGATYAWTGKGQVGQGQMTIEKARWPLQIEIRLEFFKPFKAVNLATFTFEPLADGTRVTWAMEGRNNFVCSIIGLFMNMDKCVGDDFQRGLETMKTLAETRSTATLETAALN
ncbi:MAG TPA: SRPBCC family protein [Tepidisphaeraceae bacterium]|jgi:uncharacterized protein YndB with AHSA1/START domain|nr:SRPBCC family protein [Tepidisphaeraceae bacterium]